jgi:dTDP-4-dehydrorhamnose 3,5-epimerase
MKINSIAALAIPDIKVIRFARFGDHRGYFTETFRNSDFQKHPEMEFMQGVKYLQTNESYSRKGTVRGLHFQWNPYMGKLVRTLFGRMIDLVLDIRKGSPTHGKIIAYDMPADRDADYNEWIWVPPGFAHGNVFTEDSMIEYFCSGEYSQGCEAGISPIAKDISWDLCDKGLKNIFDSIAFSTELMTDKDKNGFSMETWSANAASENFISGKM